MKQTNAQMEFLMKVPTREEVTDPHPAEAGHILVVDDESDMGWVIERIFKDAGYPVVTATTGAEGVSKFKRLANDIFLVVVDFKLPDVNGFDLIERIRDFSARTPIVVMTAFGTPEMKSEAKRLGVLAVLDKPFRVEKMLKMVRLACEAYQPNY